MERPIFFIHITKTGGQSIERMLQDAYDSVLMLDHDRDYYRIPHGYEAYSGQVAWYTMEVFEQLPWTFTFVRNPVERLISFYNYYRCMGIQQVQWIYRDMRKSWSKSIRSNLSLGDFLSQPGIDKVANNRMTRDLGAEEPLIDCAPGHGTMLSAMRVVDELNFIGLFENFPSSLSRLAETLGVDLPELPKANRIPYLVPRNLSEYNKTDRAKLLEFTKYDNVVYNYAVKRYLKEFL